MRKIRIIGNSEVHSCDNYCLYIDKHSWNHIIIRNTLMNLANFTCVSISTKRVKMER